MTLTAAALAYLLSSPDSDSSMKCHFCFQGFQNLQVSPMYLTLPKHGDSSLLHRGCGPGSFGNHLQLKHRGFIAAPGRYSAAPR
jgi:hypothetical protein